MPRGSGFIGCFSGLLRALLPGLLIASPAVAQHVSIGVYADPAGSSCTLSDPAPGIVQAHLVVASDDARITGIRFSAPPPACFHATYFGETVAPDILALGDTQTGISLAFGACKVLPVHVATISYLTFGTTPACCAYPVLADPLLTAIVATDCAFVEFEATGLAHTVNGDASCPCRPNRAPGAATGPSPADDEWEQARTPRLAWSAEDPDGDALVYDVYFGTEPEPPLVSAQQAEATFAAGPLAYGTRHYWRVDVTDAHGATTAGAVWSFVTIGSNPVNGDMTGDGFATPGDALCALRTWVNGGAPPAGCGGPLWSERGDVDCSGEITPGDGQCIFMEWLEGNCDFCTELDWPALRASPAPPRVLASLAAAGAGRVALSLAAEGATVDAFGVEVRFDPRELRPAAVRRGGRIEHFEAVEHGVTADGVLRVGGYGATVAGTPGNDLLVTVEFTVLDERGATPLAVGGFVDDLAGADAVRVPRANAAMVLLQNSPNPFRGATEIQYELPGARDRPARLVVYDVGGRLVRTLVDAPRPGGPGRAAWDGRDAAGRPAASGIYFYRLESEGSVRVRKMVLLR